MQDGMKRGPADFAKELKEKKFPHKTKKDLNEVLRKYGIDRNNIKKIPPFVPEPAKIDDEDKELEQCIKCRMGIIDSVTGSNEAVRCGVASTFLQYYTQPSTSPEELSRKELPWTPNSKL
ncbi:hypothetical protein C1645_876760 [Glomus cerebriforme]|uniref:Uncharacterized protein n=1 Tax=Glomus cerebriforme TaxID=658196 RepID=A0A397SWM6_9GLOM|nr:hypothetical protein C1645_876760 [Glomus cerebriforme]